MRYRLLAILLLIALAGCGRPRMHVSATVAIDFEVAASSKSLVPEDSSSRGPIKDFDLMRQFLQSADFKTRLGEAAHVSSSHISLFLETVTPTAPFTMTLRATTTDELDALVTNLPGVIRDYARQQGSSLSVPRTKRLG